MTKIKSLKRLFNSHLATTSSLERVPRDRFYPVKTCNDLLVVRSGCFICAEDHDLRINPARKAKEKEGVLKIKLDPGYYGKIDDFDKRFAAGIFTLVDRDSLIIVFIKYNNYIGYVSDKYMGGPSGN